MMALHKAGYLRIGYYGAATEVLLTLHAMRRYWQRVASHPKQIKAVAEAIMSDLMRARRKTVEPTEHLLVDDRDYVCRWNRGKLVVVTVLTANSTEE